MTDEAEVDPCPGCGSKEGPRPIVLLGGPRPLSRLCVYCGRKLAVVNELEALAGEVRLGVDLTRIQQIATEEVRSTVARLEVAAAPSDAPRRAPRQRGTPPEKLTPRPADASPPIPPSFDDRNRRTLEHSALPNILNVIIYIGSVYGGLTALTSSTKAAARLLHKLKVGHTPTANDLSAAGSEAIEKAFGQRVSRDPDAISWDGTAYDASWTIGDWVYTVAMGDIANNVPIVTRQARQAPPASGHP